MPRLGTGKGQTAAPAELSAAVDAAVNAGGAANPSVYSELGDYVRAQMVESGKRTLDEIKSTIAKTRDEKGRLKKARFIAAVLSLRIQGFSPKRSAEMLGVSQQRVTWALGVARKDADIVSQIDRIEKIGVPLAVDNALRGIMDGDKEYTMRALDGRGVFRNHKSVEQEIRVTKLEMTINVTAPDPRVLPPDAVLTRPGSIVGTSVLDAPRLLPQTSPAPPLPDVEFHPADVVSDGKP